MSDLVLKSMTEVITEGKKMPASSPLFKNLWHTGEVAFLLAESGIGKTILATQIACQAAKSRKVLYLDFELTAKQIADRYSDGKTVYSFPKKFYMKLLNDMLCTDEQRMQDEVHNFTINYHRQIRSKGLYASILDDIPGIGKQRKHDLLKKYKTVQNMKKQSVEELSSILPLNVAIELKDILDSLDKETDE